MIHIRDVENRLLTKRMEAKTLDSMFRRRVEMGANCAPFVSEAILREAKDVYDLHAEGTAKDLGIGQLKFLATAAEEPAGFPGTTPEVAAKLFGDLGLAVPSVHTSLPVRETKEKTLDLMNILGSKRIVSGLRTKDFKTMAAIRRSCDRFNAASAVASENGMTLGIHNHWWKYLPIDDQYVYQVMLKHLSPEIFFEVDTYWVKTAGLDPAIVVRELGARVPLLHIKDGPCKKDGPMTAVGDGIMDFHGIVEAGSTTTEWMIVELDSCATDIMEAVKKSYEYLTREKIWPTESSETSEQH